MKPTPEGRRGALYHARLSLRRARINFENAASYNPPHPYWYGEAINELLRAEYWRGVARGTESVF